MATNGAYPLARFKVLDLTRARAGPTCVRQLVDWGAEAIKIEMPGGRYKVLHAGGRRIQTVTANVVGRDIADFERDSRARIESRVKLAEGNYTVYTGTARAQAQARSDLRQR